MLDTNVLISTTLSEVGFSSQILRAARDKQVHLVVSAYILTEFSKVIRRSHITKKYKNQSEKADALIRFLNVRARFAFPQTIPAVLADDAKDDAILACAKAGKARYIVSGDKHLLLLREYEGIKILSPREFVEQVLNR